MEQLSLLSSSSFLNEKKGGVAEGGEKRTFLLENQKRQEQTAWRFTLDTPGSYLDRNNHHYHHQEPKTRTSDVMVVVQWWQKNKDRSPMGLK